MAWIKKFRWGVEAPDLRRYIGRACKVKDDNGNPRVVECEEILGSVAHPTRFQINAKEKSYLISMLDFFAQMNGETVTEDEIKAFEEQIFEVKATPSFKPFAKDKRKIWTPR